MSEYKNPKNLVIAPEKKRNLVYIFLESMESSFLDSTHGGLMNKNLIPQLQQLADENINFSATNHIGGGYDTAGTGWTIAALTAKLIGVPFNIPVIGNKSDMINFLPNAITLTDILDDAGYKQIFLCGSDKHFASRNVLFETHGNVEVHDINYYKDQQKLPKDYSVFWGMEDAKLYSFAREELTMLSKQKKPFNLMLLTVDTHFPNGYECQNCQKVYTTGKNPQMKNAIRCADNQLSNFIKWMQEQDWYENTSIVIVGVHLMMLSDSTDFFDIKNENLYSGYEIENLAEMNKNRTNSEKRFWIDVFINPAKPIKKEQTKNRLFSSYDMFPTVLACLGFSIQGERLGFGTNLFSEEKTLAERYNKDYIDEKTMEANRQYRSFYVTTQNEEEN